MSNLVPLSLSLSLSLSTGFQRLAEDLIRVGTLHGESIKHEDVSLLLPHRTTVSRNADAMYVQVKNHVKPMLQRAVERNTLACTIDLWTNKHDNRLVKLQ